MKKRICAFAIASLFASCGSSSQPKSYSEGTFGYDVEFLSRRDDVIILKSDENSQIVVSPAYQGKVFTSTVDGLDGRSIGWMNHGAFDAPINEHINSYGGENRLWLGPEGGTYSIFFKDSEEQNFDNWHTPTAIDIEKWDVKSQSESSVVVTKMVEVTNYRGTNLKVEIDRTISMLTIQQSEDMLGVEIAPDVKSVGYVSSNKITNCNDFEWTKQTGTVCTWLLDLYPVSESAVTIVPYVEGDDQELGTIATTNYFGDMPKERVSFKDGVFLFKTDGNYRAKVGMSALRSKGYAANYSPELGTLTIVKYDVHKDAEYLNPAWDPEAEPFPGDVLNAYNDGKLEDGTQMGPFLELESSSPAALLAAGESQTHNHVVFHFVGDGVALEPIAQAVLGVSLREAVATLR